MPNPVCRRGDVCLCGFFRAVATSLPQAGVAVKYLSSDSMNMYVGTSLLLQFVPDGAASGECESPCLLRCPPQRRHTWVLPDMSDCEGFHVWNVRWGWKSNITFPVCFYSPVHMFTCDSSVRPASDLRFYTPNSFELVSCNLLTRLSQFWCSLVSLAA